METFVDDLNTQVCLFTKDNAKSFCDNKTLINWETPAFGT